MENENFEAAYEAYTQDAFAAEAEAYWNRVLAEKEMIAADKPKDNAVKIPVSRPSANQSGERPFFVPSKADRDRGGGGTRRRAAVGGNAGGILVL